MRRHGRYGNWPGQSDARRGGKGGGNGPAGVLHIGAMQGQAGGARSSVGNGRQDIVF